MKRVLRAAIWWLEVAALVAVLLLAVHSYSGIFCEGI